MQTTGGAGFGAPDPLAERREQLAPEPVLVAREIRGRGRARVEIGVGAERGPPRHPPGHHVAVLKLRDRPAVDGLGLRWIAAGTLPEAPDIRPSVTSATCMPAILDHAQGRGQGVQLRHPVGLRPLEAHHARRDRRPARRPRTPP